jgi:hypothetical protein
MPDRQDTLLICCGAVAREVVSLVERNGWEHMRVECLPAHLHNTPERIPEAIRDKIRAARDRFDDILVLYSDCGTGGRLDAILAEEGVERIGGSHCYEVFAGRDGFAALMAEEPGTFFVTDFLARHFERLVFKGLGLDRYPRLRDNYFGHYKRLVYLAQTDDPELEALAKRAAESVGLAFEKRRTGYGDFESFLQGRADCAIPRLRSDTGDGTRVQPKARSSS